MSDEMQVKLGDLFSREFLRTCSRFNSVEEFFGAADLGLVTIDDLKDVPDAKLDEFVRANTTYKSFDDMIGDAGAFYVKKQLEL